MAAIASAVSDGSRRSSNGLRVMNIDAKFELMAFSTNDRPGMPSVWATPGVSRAIFLDALDDLDRALERGRVGQLDVDDQAALVLDGDEAGGNAGEAEARQADQADIDQEHDRAQAEGPAHDAAVDVRSPRRRPS